MYIVFLRFSDNRDQAGQFMEDHRVCIQRGVDDGVFLLAGYLQPQAGGAIMAHNTTLEELQARLHKDPFVAENVVRAEILEISPTRADERLAFLLG